MASTKGSETDYEIRFSELTVDQSAIAAVIKRMGIRVKHLEGRLTKSFETFSAQGINTIQLTISDLSPESLEKMRISLRVFSCYHLALEKETPITYVKNNKKYSLPPIANEDGQPDPNLTILAALNDLNPDMAQDIVRKVSAARQNPKFAEAASQSPDVFHTIFAIKSLRDKFAKPPIQVNSGREAVALQAAAAATGGTMPMGSGTGVGPVNSASAAYGGQIMGPTAAKADVARYVKETYGSSPGTAGQMMKSVYGQDYKQMDSSGLGDRLKLVTNLLVTMENSPKGQEFMQAVKDRIQAGMDQVPENILDDMVVQGDTVKIWDGDQEQIVGKVDDNLRGALDAAKDRSAARRKLKPVINPEDDFTPQDYEDLSKNFNVPLEEAEEIATIFKRCFDRQGNFQKANFEKNVSDFSRHDKKVFDILWEFLKGASRRNDRLPFLNSFQFLNNEIKQPIKAIRALLSDFVVDPATVKYSDRNAMMLVSMFVRTYNKEINMDIEITPEEVLLVQVGLDPKATNYAAWKIDGEQKRFIEKIVTIRKHLIDAYDPQTVLTEMMPVRFLLALEREVHMFLALTGGKTAASVLRGALNVYGNPESQVYLLEESHNNMTALLQHLSVIVRGFTRLGTAEDTALLEVIRQKEDGFLALSEVPRHAALVKRVMGWVDAALQQVKRRKKTDPDPSTD